MLEKKEKVLLKKAGQEVEKAKEYTRSKNKRGTNLNCFFLFFCDCYDSHVSYNIQSKPCCASLILCSGYTVFEKEEVI